MRARAALDPARQAARTSSRTPRRTAALLRVAAALGAAGYAALALAAPDAKVLAAAQACEPDARALLERLVRIDSGTANIKGLDEVRGILAAELQKLGAAVESVPAAAPNMADSLVATLTGAGRGRILLIAHMDTVFQPGVAAQRPYRVEGDHGIGPGAGDDKSGVVAALCALRVVQRIEFRDYARIVLILNSNEEIGSPGTRALIAAKARDSDASLNLERGVPPDGVVVARKGNATITLEISGRAAHSGLEPEKGRNAVVEAAHQVQRLATLANPAKETTVNVTMIDGGNAANVIPEHATIKADVRAFTTEELDRVEKDMQALARDTVVPDVTVKASMVRGFPPWPRADSTDALLARAQRLYAEIGGTLAAIAVGSSSDASLPPEVGTPSIDGFGPLGGGAHGADDYVDLASIARRTYLIARMIMDLGQNPPLRTAARGPARPRRSVRPRPCRAA